MTPDTGKSKEEGELDRTDKLPIHKDVLIDEDVQDDTVHLDSTVVLSGSPPAAMSEPARADFVRPAAVDLPSLAQSVRSVEERIARQIADHEALSRLYEKSRDAESAATARATALAAALTIAQSALAVEQHRVREMEQALADETAAAEAARARVDAALRDAERHQGETRTLREALAARDATIVQVLHSLGERDAQLHSLQREHAHTVPVLEAQSQASAQLEADLQAERSRTEALALELKNAQQSVAELTAQMKRGESEIQLTRRELSTVKGQADAYLEALQTREWRRGFDHNLFLEGDAQADAARAGHGMLQAERDRLEETAAVLSGKLIEQEETIAKKTRELEEMQRARRELDARLDVLEGESKRLQGEVAAREQTIAQARVLGAEEAQRIKELTDLQAASEKQLAEQSAQIAQLQAAAETREDEMTVLLAHLHEARRPAQSLLSDAKRLSDELAQKSLSLEQLSEENCGLRAALERTRGALEEREFLIRRLERSESNNANALGRIQTTIEKLGAAPAGVPGPASAAAECSAELIGLDGDRTAYSLARRTRIGRAPGCELHIDSASVSRYHALVVKGQRELIIEDLNSTNGVVVNGRKISRYALQDGDLVTIGEIQFRCALTLPPPEAAPAAYHDP